MSKSYLTQNPTLFKKSSNYNSPVSLKSTMKNQPIDIDQLARELIEKQQQRVKQLSFKVKVYEVKIKQQKSARLDYSPQLKILQQQIMQLRKQDQDILKQINNCKQVQNQVKPIQYYLWKKKQRISTYDMSIAALCSEIQQQRHNLEEQIQQHRHQSQDLLAQIQQLQEKIVSFNNSSQELSSKKINLGKQENQEEMASIFVQNALLRQQYNPLVSQIQILQQNKDIVCMQVIDSVQSIQSALKSFYQSQKIRMARQCKQIPMEIKDNQVSPLNKEEQAYSIDPLINDYAYKLRQLHQRGPQQVRRLITPIMQPLPWQKIDFKQFVSVDPRSQHIYNEYRRLESQYIQNQGQTQKLQSQLKRITAQIAIQQQKSNQISVNIQKLKSRLHKS